MSENYPIDFVVTWVDGNDPNVRFRDWDNMQYWFRAVEKFAP